MSERARPRIPEATVARLPLYLRSVMYECDATKTARPGDRKRVLNDAPALKRA